jgi:hypothetical protein
MLVSFTRPYLEVDVWVMLRWFAIIYNFFVAGFTMGASSNARNQMRSSISSRYEYAHWREGEALTVEPTSALDDEAKIKREFCWRCD